MKTICVIQPYIFPYLPYYQLAHAVDEFWIFDDVQYIRRGWMNRNYILNNGQRQLFTLPVAKGSRSDLISEKQLSDDFAKSLDNLILSIRNSYARAPHVDVVLGMLAELSLSTWESFLEFSSRSLELTFRRLGVHAPMRRTSRLDIPDELHGAERIIEVCHRAGAQHYVNPIGGLALYDEDSFAQAGLRLSFLKGELPEYPHGAKGAFEPGLSILDFLAWVSPTDYDRFLQSYKLIGGQDGRDQLQAPG
jgi:hypothetical protein